MSLSKLLTEMTEQFRVTTVLTRGKKGTEEVKTVNYFTREEVLHALNKPDDYGGITNLIKPSGLEIENMLTQLEYFNISEVGDGKQAGPSLELRRTLTSIGENLPFKIKMEVITKESDKGALNFNDITDTENEKDNTKDYISNQELVDSVNQFKKLIQGI